ncbi:hypothetical protein [Lentilactobacillus diolivorans]|uniref:Lipoprotein n=2 Tax=Lentilactobacillus diolivorans TaxID=179838 RepID=A0A0R1SQN6_9LACO|nr:hypothetical protein [Lentilactobacillus diolivorans]KRL68565.1 lipoprotein [Lentilactobacillus diolivorans DSM 14421]GEP24605.1 lipoprotein [Lentilactobacillus diolivorans]
MKRTLLIVGAMLALVLGGCGNQSQSKNSSSTSESTSAKSSSSNSSTSSNSSSAASSSTASGSSAAAHRSDANTNTYLRLSKFNQQLTQKLGSIKLPKNDGLSEHNGYVNVRYSGDQANYQISYSVGDQARALNATALKNENPYAVLTRKTYDSNDQAGQQIDQHDIENGLPKVNLGSNIHGTIDSAAGSEYLTWNEGRWNLTVHADRVANEDATQLGKQTVQLLDSYTLPVPNTKGAIMFDSQIVDRQRDQKIAWQDGNSVYTLQTHSPETGIRMAASIS